MIGTARQKRVFKTRLLRLAAFLRTVPKKRFNMRWWVGPGWTGDQTLSCGTSACAMGWASTMPEFRRLGLRLAPNHQIALRIPKTNRITTGGSTPFIVARKLFGLEEDEANYLFGSMDHTPKTKVLQIRKFVKEVDA